MKNFFTFLLLGLAVGFVSCDDENTENDAKWFQPLQTTVSGTTVEVSCLTRFGDGVLGNLGIGFIYAPSGTGDSVETTNCTIEGSRMSATLSGLSAETDYTVYAFADLSAGRMLSKAAVFRTGTAGEAPDPGPDPEPDEPAFGTPSATEVTTTTATLNCGFTFDADASEYTLYFLYKDRSATSGYSRVDVSSGTGAKTAALTGLAPDMEYDFHLCADWNKKTYTSASAMFRTEKQGVEPPPASNTKYAGWAELPTWEQTNTDYRFVEHFCAMGTSSSAPKARNFSACFSAGMKCPVWVAAPLHDAYAKKNVERKNSYKDDPDISSSIQVGKWDGYTRGHMLGSAERLVSREANNQVMYFSNIGPQLGQDAYFNTGGGQWNTAEDWVDKQWRDLADTCYQVVGTHWSDTKTVVSGTTIPTHYYVVLLKAKKSAGNKWVVNCTRDELQSIGIWIEHKSYSKSEVVKPDNFASKGIFLPVSEIEKKTGHTFFTNVANAPKDTYNVSDWNF